MKGEFGVEQMVRWATFGGLLLAPGDGFGGVQGVIRVPIVRWCDNTAGGSCQLIAPWMFYRCSTDRR